MKLSIVLIWMLYTCVVYGKKTLKPVVERLSIPNGANCGARIPAYMVMESQKLLTEDKLFYEDVDEEECKIMCSDNKDAHGASVLCASFTYIAKSRMCSLNRAKSPPNGKAQLKAAAGSRYYEKICLPDGSPATCGDAPFFRANQAVLIGFAKNMSKVASMSACIDSCVLDKSKKDGCKSAMYFSATKECILNTASAQGAPDVFNEEMDEEKVVYFENGCVMANQIRDQKPSTSPAHPKSSSKLLKSKSKESKRPLTTTATGHVTGDDEVTGTSEQPSRSTQAPKPLELATYGPWAEWTRCDRPDGRRVRRRKCPKNARCEGLNLDTQWCSDVDISELALGGQGGLNDPEDLEDTTGGTPAAPTAEPPADPSDPRSSEEVPQDEEDAPTTRRPKITRRPKTSSTLSPVESAGTFAPTSEKWTPWSEECRPFDEPRVVCRDGRRIGFQIRQCLKSPFECQGPFFRYCQIQC